jgi:hypothetical protein
MVIELANLQVLEKKYGRATRDARDFLRKAYRKVDGPDLPYLLRHHPDDEDFSEEAIITDDETWLRDSFDSLLTYYGVLEIGCLIGFVPFPLPRPLKEEALLHLSDPAVRRYYEEYYPTLLPELFRLRLVGRQDLRETEGSAAAALFMDFLDISALIEDDEDVDCFLWLLDSGVFYENEEDDETAIDLEDLLSVLEDYDSFVAAVACKPSDQGYLEQAVQGLGKFLTFCPALEQVLDRARRYPYLQSAMWHYHGYWFGYLSTEIGGDLRNAVQHFARWQSKDTKPRERRESRASIRQMARTLKRLTGRGFDRPLRAAVRAALKSRKPHGRGPGSGL